MVTSRHQNAGQSHSLLTENKYAYFENVRISSMWEEQYQQSYIPEEI